MELFIGIVESSKISIGIVTPASAQLPRNGLHLGLNGRIEIEVALRRLWQTSFGC